MGPLPARSALFAALLLLLGAGLAHGSLMAIDLGSDYMRAVLVKPSGRGNPLQIVVNEMSRRKSPALVGVAGEDRLLGEEASSFAIRYPTTIFSRSRDLLGRSAADPFVQNLLSANALPYQLEDHPERKTVMARVNETAAYLAEELVVRWGGPRSRERRWTARRCAAVRSCATVRPSCPVARRCRRRVAGAPGAAPACSSPLHTPCSRAGSAPAGGRPSRLQAVDLKAAAPRGRLGTPRPPHPRPSLLPPGRRAAVRKADHR